MPDKPTMREQKMDKSLRVLVDMYVANPGLRCEFICCITPPHASSLTKAERRKDKVWRAWDNARKALGQDCK